MNVYPGTLLRELVNQRRGLIVPGAANALAARVIQATGFEAVYLSGAGLTWALSAYRTLHSTPRRFVMQSSSPSLWALIRASEMR